MPSFRVIAAAAAALAAAIVFMQAPASARPCDPGEAACAEARPGTPLRLNQFLKQKRAAKPAVVDEARNKPPAAKADSGPAPAQPAENVTVESKTDVAQAPASDSGPVRTVETDGVAITSADELNEIDALAANVQVVAANELNEIDLAAGTSGLNARALASMASADPSVASMADTPADRAWIGKLLAAFAGTIAVAAAARLLIA